MARWAKRPPKSVKKETWGIPKGSQRHPKMPNKRGLIFEALWNGVCVVANASTIRCLGWMALIPNGRGYRS